MDRFDWYKYHPAWSGEHWFWSDALDPPGQRIIWTVYDASMRQLARGEAYGQGQLGIYLFYGKTYYISVENANNVVGCRRDCLEP